MTAAWLIGVLVCTFPLAAITTVVAFDGIAGGCILVGDGSVRGGDGGAGVCVGVGVVTVFLFRCGFVLHGSNEYTSQWDKGCPALPSHSIALLLASRGKDE